jgi:hypothetical protein
MPAAPSLFARSFDIERIDGRRHEHHAIAWRDAGNAVRSEQHGLHLRASTTSTMMTSDARASSAGEAQTRCAVADGARLRVDPDVPRRRRNAGTNEALDDTATHRAGADDADAQRDGRRLRRRHLTAENGWQSLR